MKLIGMSTLIVTLFATSLFVQSEARRFDQKSIELQVRDLQFEARNINLILSKIAYQYGVPVSLEVAKNDDLLNGKELKIDVKNGTIADVLDSIVKQAPSYTWEVSDDIIKVFPKSDFREPLLQALLEIRIRHFVVAKPMSKQTFREALTERKELRSLFDSYGVSFYNEIFSTVQLQPLGKNCSMDLKNASVRSILDYVIKNSETKYWFIKGSGEDLSLNL